MDTVLWSGSSESEISQEKGINIDDITPYGIGKVSLFLIEYMYMPMGTVPLHAAISVTLLMTCMHTSFCVPETLH
jgi:hypothetical protein